MKPRSRAMVLAAAHAPLRLVERDVPEPGAREVLVRVDACGVCRTDLHIVDGELPQPRLPLVPGHEVVGRVEALGAGVTTFAIGDRVGVPWLGATCGACPYCREHRENLCDAPQFTGYTRDGGYADHVVATRRFCFPLPEAFDDVARRAAAVRRADRLPRAGDGGRRRAARRSTASAPPRTSSRRSRSGRGARSTPSRGRATSRRRRSRARSARVGRRLRRGAAGAARRRADLRAGRRARSGRAARTCARAASSSAPAST